MLQGNPLSKEEGAWAATFTLRTASSLHGQARSRAHLCSSLLQGHAPQGWRNNLPPALWQVQAVGLRLLSLPAKRLLKA